MQLTLPIADRFRRPAVVLLTLAYLAGVVGLHLPLLQPWFMPLVPLNLLASLLLLLAFHPDWRSSFVFYCVLCFLIGYWVEVLGVYTGMVFGRYAYGPTLGWSLLGVPLVIGVNWLTLSYCCGSLFDLLPVPIYLKTILAATLMVALDVLIEPVAIRLDFWTWYGEPIPLRNYLGWWIVSAILLAIWYGLPFAKKNPLALPLLLLQFLFFGLSSLVARLM